MQKRINMNISNSWNKPMRSREEAVNDLASHWEFHLGDQVLLLDL